MVDDFKERIILRMRGALSITNSFRRAFNRYEGINPKSACHIMQISLEARR